MKKIFLIQTRWDDEVFAGVARFTRSHSLQLGLPGNAVVPGVDVGQFSGGGVIMKLDDVGKQTALLRLVREGGCPAVVIGEGAPFGVTSVRSNLDDVARLVVAHFSRRRFDRLTLVLEPTNIFAQVLLKKIEAISDGVMALGTIVAEQVPDWLAKTEGPQALVACDDFVAFTIAEECFRLGYKVPEDVAILGMGDNASLCTSGRVELSSMDLNRKQLGYQAAKILTLAGQESRRSPDIRIPPLGIARRRSTDTMVISNPRAAMVFRFLRENFRSPVQRWEIHQLLGKDAIRAERIFKKAVGRTITQELCRLRVEAARPLLMNEDLSGEEIAASCGFDGRYSFERAFCREYGRTPWAYRRELRAETSSRFEEICAR